MLSRCSIRYKLLIGFALLSLIVVVLSVSGILGVSSYRRLVRTVSARAAELPLADEVTRRVVDLRITFGHLRASHDVGDQQGHNSLVREQFQLGLLEVGQALRRYSEQLQQNEPNGTGIADNRDEWDTVRNIQRTLERIDQLSNAHDWAVRDRAADNLRDELDELYALASGLPRHLQDRMRQLKGNARGAYHALLASTLTTSVLAGAMLGLLVWLFYCWILKPLRVLIHGSRRVAAGDFEHRIGLPSHDEMAELAAAMNDMTARFCEIRDDLDRQVKQRTKEVVRSEQLASVGFLAAGVAHEINNPLASIAWSAEALEARLHDILYRSDCQLPEEQDPEIKVLKDYLRRIQNEAFRCKGITERLLDFSRIGDMARHETDLREIVDDVIEMAKHLGRYKGKRIEFECRARVPALVNAQEIKQVLLNLLTNALDSLDADGLVQVELTAVRDRAVLTVRDNGCGMTEEVLEHLFEPFFTRRRDGQGTGLGLSITYRIVSDHGGTLEAVSDGPGTGSLFRLTLPLHETNHESYPRKLQAA